MFASEEKSIRRMPLRRRGTSFSVPTSAVEIYADPYC